MKLNLVNFGCYDKYTIEFNDASMNLISAPSGAGKTSLLRAIVFAIYGKGTKVVKDGYTH